jgi:hypothetical protein
MLMNFIEHNTIAPYYISIGGKKGKHCKFHIMVLLKETNMPILDLHVRFIASMI